jgi:hypothetical protein
MTSEEKLKKVIEEANFTYEEKELFEDLVSGMDADELVEGIINGVDDIIESIQEFADSNVSVYTSDRMRWLTENMNRADQEEAIACGARTAEEIAAFCWVKANEEDLTNAAWKAKDILDEMEQEEEG